VNSLGRALVAALTFLVAVRTPVLAAPSPPPAALIEALMRDPEYAACTSESNRTPSAFARSALRIEPLLLRSGEQMMTVSVLDSPCLTRNSVTRYTIYERLPDATWRQVLDTQTMSDGVARTDGSVLVDGHETAETIDQLTYAWDGSEYDFRPDRSLRDDVSFGVRPFQISLQFARGASSLTRTAAAYGGLGDSYVFSARAGQRATLRLRSDSRFLPVGFYYGPGSETELALDRTGSARLPVTGTYDFFVDPVRQDELAAYRLTLSIR
jgi:hypothetical protein